MCTIRIECPSYCSVKRDHRFLKISDGEEYSPMLIISYLEAISQKTKNNKKINIEIPVFILFTI
jgi:hypothetical protein